MQAVPQRTPSADTVKEKCRKFLANLLELSSREPKAVERNVRNLIQELVDTKVEPEEFCDRLERLLNASPQPCLIGFLKVTDNCTQGKKIPVCELLNTYLRHIITKLVHNH